MSITSFPFIALVAVAFLIFAGLLERVLERLRLNRSEAFAILFAILAGSFLPDIPLYRGLSINIGGALIPLGIIIYLLWTADTPKEKSRGILTMLLAAAAVYATDKFLPLEPGLISFDIDPLYLPAVIAAVFAYLAGRSRRSAFIGALGGVLLLDLFTWIESSLYFPGNAAVVLGGGGILGGAVLAGLLAVFLAEVVGEVRERLERGTKDD